MRTSLLHYFSLCVLCCFCFVAVVNLCPYFGTILLLSGFVNRYVILRMKRIVITSGGVPKNHRIPYKINTSQQNKYLNKHFSSRWLIRIVHIVNIERKVPLDLVSVTSGQFLSRAQVTFHNLP